MIEKNPDLASSLQDSMSAPLIALSKRFQAMKVKENPVKMGIPASDSRIDEQFQHALFIDPSLVKYKLTAKDLASASSLKKLIETHCHALSYAFQIKKCSVPTCYYCIEHPVRLPPEQFSELNYLPLPLLDASKEHFLKEVFWKPLSSKDRPSHVASPTEEQKQTDKDRKTLLVAGKVHGIIKCGECFKPRCIYSSAKLTRQEETEIVIVKCARVGNHFLVRVVVLL